MLVLLPAVIVFVRDEAHSYYVEASFIPTGLILEVGHSMTQFAIVEVICLASLWTNELLRLSLLEEGRLGSKLELIPSVLEVEVVADGLIECPISIMIYEEHVLSFGHHR